MDVKVGNAPISWGVCEIEDWGPQLPFRQVLDEHRAAGYAGTETGPWGYLPRDPELMRAELAGRGLELAGAFVPLNLRDPQQRGEVEHRVRATAELLHALGARHILFSDEGDAARRQIAGRPNETVRNGIPRDEWPAYAAAATRLAELVRDEFGLIACWHSHGGTYIEHPAEIAALLERTDPELLRLCLDTGHVAFGGGDPVEIARTYAARIGYVHLKDIDQARLAAGIARGWDYTTAAQNDVFVELGTGSVDLGAIMAGLRQAEYRGWIIVEQDRVARPGVELLASATRSRSYLRERFGV